MSYPSSEISASTVSTFSQLDGCQLAVGSEGLVIGGWDGVIKIIPNDKEESKAIYRDTIHPKEPVRGLLTSTSGNIIWCNDFQLVATSPDLKEVLVRVEARHVETCNQLLKQIFSGATKRGYRLARKATFCTGGTVPQGLFASIRLGWKL